MQRVPHVNIYVKASPPRTLRPPTDLAYARVCIIRNAHAVASVYIGDICVVVMSAHGMSIGVRDYTYRYARVRRSADARDSIKRAHLAHMRLYECDRDFITATCVYVCVFGEMYGSGRFVEMWGGGWMIFFRLV